MDRRTFLTRSGLALGTILVGDDLIEELARLTHIRKSFPSADVARDEEAARERVLVAYSYHSYAWHDLQEVLAKTRPGWPVYTVPPNIIYRLPARSSHGSS